MPILDIMNAFFIFYCAFLTPSEKEKFRHIKDNILSGASTESKKRIKKIWSDAKGKRYDREREAKKETIGLEHTVYAKRH